MGPQTLTEAIKEAEKFQGHTANNFHTSTHFIGQHYVQR